MPAISFGGLASGLDTDGIIQQLMALESRPITLLTQQRTNIQNRAGAYKDLNTRFSGLENAAFELTKISNIVGRKASSSDSEALLATASGNAVPGSYDVEVLRLATSTKVRTGTGAAQGNTLGGIADATNFSGETIGQINSNRRLREDLAEGTFFVNGQQVLIANSDTLAGVLNKITTAAPGVTGSLVTDPAKGGLSLQLNSASPITVSAGTSNFLNLFKLDTATFSSGSLTSTDAVNAVRSDINLDGSEGDTNLAQAVGTGTMTINGTSIEYNSTNDSLSDIISRINASQAGVRAAFSDLGGGRVTLTNKTNGPAGISISDSGTLAAALGLSATDSQVIGQAAQVRIDGGPVQSFNKNSGITAAGLEGVILDLRDAEPGSPFTVTIDANTDPAIDKVQNFVDQYNSTMQRINELTSYNAETRQKGLLLSDSTVTGIRNRLNETVFRQIGGLSGNRSFGSLAEIGISTGAIGSNAGTATQLQLDSGKLREALAADPTRVAQLLGAEETSTGEAGIMERLKTYLDGLSNATGLFAQRQDVLEDQIGQLGDRINLLNERLATKQERLERQFTALERNISRLQSQQSSLGSLFN